MIKKGLLAKLERLCWCAKIDDAKKKGKKCICKTSCQTKILKHNLLNARKTSQRYYLKYTYFVSPLVTWKKCAYMYLHTVGVISQNVTPILYCKRALLIIWVWPIWVGPAHCPLGQSILDTSRSKNPKMGNF